IRRTNTHRIHRRSHLTLRICNPDCLTHDGILHLQVARTWAIKGRPRKPEKVVLGRARQSWHAGAAAVNSSQPQRGLGSVRHPAKTEKGIAQSTSQGLTVEACLGRSAAWLTPDSAVTAVTKFRSVMRSIGRLLL